MTEISVIMPVYNAKEEYFKEAIESILNQTFTDFELIIVDDASKPYIENIVNSYSDSRIHYCKLLQNQGAANARNTGIAIATGKYLAFLDADDIALPTRFERQHLFLEAHPDIGVLGTQTQIIGDDSHKMHFPTPTKHQDIENHLIFTGCVFCQSSIMLRKEILDTNNLRYNDRFIPAEDYALWLDLIGKTKFEVLEETLVQYRFYQQNISHQQNSKQVKKCNEAQFEIIKSYCNMTPAQNKLLKTYFLDRSLPIETLHNLYPIIDKAMTILISQGFPKKDVFRLIKKKFKKLYYHTHGLKEQWHLLKSPINRLFNIPYYWRFYCLITRGLI